MTTPPEVPEGRCMVCRVAWEPCRRCRGQVKRAKAEETMRRNGTQRPRGQFGPALTFRRPPDMPTYFPRINGDDNADTDA